MLKKLALGTVVASTTVLMTAPMAIAAPSEPSPLPTLFATKSQCFEAGTAKLASQGGGGSKYSFDCEKTVNWAEPGVAGCPPARPGHDGCIGKYFVLTSKYN